MKTGAARSMAVMQSTNTERDRAPEWAPAQWSGRALAALGSDEPGEQLEGAFGVGHLAAVGEIRVHALAGQSEESAEVGLGAAFAEVGPELRAEFVPEGRIFAGAERGAFPRAAGHAVGLGGPVGDGLGENQNEFAELGGDFAAFGEGS